MKIILVQSAGIFYVVKYGFYLVIFEADNNKLLLNPNLFDVCYKNQYPRYKFLEGIIHQKHETLLIKIHLLPKLTLSLLGVTDEKFPPTLPICL